MKIKANKYYQFTGHKGNVYALAADSQDQSFYSTGSDGLIVNWDLEQKSEGKVVAKVDTSVYALHFHAAKNILIIGQNHDGIHLFDAKSKKIIGSLKLTDGYIFDIKTVGDEIIVACGDGILYRIDALNLGIKKKIKLSSSSLRSISVHQESDVIAVASSDNSTYLVNDDKINLCKAHDNSVFKVLFSPDGQHMISGGRDAYMKFWEFHDNELQLIESIPAHLFTINDMAFSPDNTYLATASKDKTIKIWNYKERKLLKVIDHTRSGGHVSSVNKLIWSRYNNLLISASDDRTICSWDLEFNH